MGGKKSTWILGTAFLALVILAGTWFFAVSPTLGSAQQTRTDAQSVEDHNTLLRKDLVTLMKQYDDLDDYQATLTKLHVQIPTTAKLADYTREIVALAKDRHAVITSLTAGTPVPVLPAAPVVAAAAPAAAAPAAAAPAAASVGGAPIPGFVAVPIEVTALGTTSNVVSFLDGLQTSSDRLFLVTTMNGTGTSAAAASGGRPATSAGDVELRISGFIYVLQDPTDRADPATGSDKTPLPTPDDSKLKFSSGV